MEEFIEHFKTVKGKQKLLAFLDEFGFIVDTNLDESAIKNDMRRRFKFYDYSNIFNRPETLPSIKKLLVKFDEKKYDEIVKILPYYTDKELEELRIALNTKYSLNIKPLNVSFREDQQIIKTFIKHFDDSNIELSPVEMYVKLYKQLRELYETSGTKDEFMLGKLIGMTYGVSGNPATWKMIEKAYEGKYEEFLETIKDYISKNFIGV